MLNESLFTFLYNAIIVKEEKNTLSSTKVSNQSLHWTCSKQRGYMGLFHIKISKMPLVTCSFPTHREPVPNLQNFLQCLLAQKESTILILFEMNTTVKLINPRAFCKHNVNVCVKYLLTSKDELSSGIIKHFLLLNDLQVRGKTLLRKNILREIKTIRRNRDGL